MNVDEVYVTIGKKIRQARKERGLKQDDLARAISFTRASITNIERGKQRVLLHTVCEIAVALAMEPSSLLPTLDDLVGLQGDLFAAQRLEEDLPKDLSPEEREWIHSTITARKKRG